MSSLPNLQSLINTWEVEHNQVNHAARAEYHRHKAELRGGGEDHLTPEELTVIDGIFRGVEHRRTKKHKLVLKSIREFLKKVKRRQTNSENNDTILEIGVEFTERPNRRIRDISTVKSSSIFRPLETPAANEHAQPFWRLRGSQLQVSDKFIEFRDDFMDSNKKYQVGGVGVVRRMKKALSQRLNFEVKYIYKYRSGDERQLGKMTIMDVFKVSDNTQKKFAYFQAVDSRFNGEDNQYWYRFEERTFDALE